MSGRARRRWLRVEFRTGGDLPWVRATNGLLTGTLRHLRQQPAFCNRFQCARQAGGTHVPLGQQQGRAPV